MASERIREWVVATQLYLLSYHHPGWLTGPQLDDYSRHSIAWRLILTLGAGDGGETLDEAIISPVSHRCQYDRSRLPGDPGACHLSVSVDSPHFYRLKFPTLWQKGKFEKLPYKVGFCKSAKGKVI